MRELQLRILLIMCDLLVKCNTLIRPYISKKNVSKLKEQLNRIAIKQHKCCDLLCKLLSLFVICFVEIKVSLKCAMIWR